MNHDLSLLANIESHDTLTYYRIVDYFKRDYLGFSRSFPLLFCLCPKSSLVFS